MAVKNSQEQEIDIISDFIEMSIIVEVGFIIFLKDLYGLYRVWEESNKLIKLMPKYPCKPRLEHGPWGTGFFFSQLWMGHKVLSIWEILKLK